MRAYIYTHKYILTSWGLYKSDGKVKCLRHQSHNLNIHPERFGHVSAGVEEDVGVPFERYYLY